MTKIYARDILNQTFVNHAISLLTILAIKSLKIALLAGMGQLHTYSILSEPSEPKNSHEFAEKFKFDYKNAIAVTFIWISFWLTDHFLIKSDPFDF